MVALYAGFDERADHLRRADELTSRFLSKMSHEFRTPLNSILALSRLLPLGPRDADHPKSELSADLLVSAIRHAIDGSKMSAPA